MCNKNYWYAIVYKSLGKIYIDARYTNKHTIKKEFKQLQVRKLLAIRKISETVANNIRKTNRG